MFSLKRSKIIKVIIHSLLFLFGFLFILYSYHFTHFISNYKSTTTFFEQTKYFHEKYLKYVERVAEYIQYKEKGYIEAAGYVYENPDISSILDTNGIERKNNDKKDNADYSDQDAFEYYNKVLNIDNTNFVYYVKNTKTNEEYFSPTLKKDTIEFKNPDDFIQNIERLNSYLVVNTNTSRYASSINNKNNYITTDDISWVIKCITGALPRDNVSADETLNGTNVLTTVDDNQSASTDSNQYLIYTGVLNKYPYQDIFRENRDMFYESYHNYKASLYLIPISFFSSAILLSFLVSMVGKRKKKGTIRLTNFDRIPTEVALICVSTLFALMMYYGTSPLIKIIHSKYGFRLEIAFLCVYILAYPIPIFTFFSIVKRIMARTLLSNSLIYRLITSIRTNLKQFILYKDITIQVAFAFGIFLFVKLFASLFLILSIPNGIVIYYGISFIDYCFAGYCIFRFTISLQIVISETKKIADGDFNHKIPERELSGYMIRLGNYINHISDGFSDAVDEKLKSERLKTELITNVSHDIKTPLTSIINYVDLLKKENIENETASSYLKVLEAKSWRLKTLIEDLVEVSKASSGTTNLHLERLNIVELIRQSAGEFEDKLISHNLELVLTIPDEPVYILADGRSTFRIIENIFSNVNKYALSGTRVYVDVTQKSKTVSVSVKNISANKLNIDSSELMERFVRGDIARNTEGSGLGLSIAKSLASLQNATFDIVLDGDLFKAVVCFTTID